METYDDKMKNIFIKSFKEVLNDNFALCTDIMNDMLNGGHQSKKLYEQLQLASNKVLEKYNVDINDIKYINKHVAEWTVDTIPLVVSRLIQERK